MSLELYINQYKAQAKQNQPELLRHDLSVPTVSENHIGLVQTIFPPKPFQPIPPGSDRPSDTTMEERNDLTDREIQARYPFPQKNQMREVKQSASDLSDILVGTN